ncbi:hypothetical protein NL369_28925, partial [Klebsiella pneumoniae]|nr:hypothetical protein [Klebsiella pneumoniae]
FYGFSPILRIVHDYLNSNCVPLTKNIKNHNTVTQKYIHKSQFVAFMLTMLALPVMPRYDQLYN